MASTLVHPPATKVSWADMCESDYEDDEALYANPFPEPAPSGSVAHQHIEALTEDIDTAAVSVLPADDENGPAITVVTSFTEIMRQQAEEKEVAAPVGPPVYLYHGAYPIAPDGTCASTYLVYPPAPPEAYYYAHCNMYAPAWMVPPPDLGVPSSVLERYANLPKSVRAVYDDPERVALLCGYCIEYKNLEFGGEGNKTVGAFCGSCLVALSRAPAYACGCGNPRHLDALAKPSGKVCSTCHQRDARRKKGRRGGRR